VRIDRRGRLRIVADGLPSIALGGFEVIGPSRVVLADGRAWVVTGFAHAVLPPRPGEAALLRIHPRTGAVAVAADVGAVERATDPDGFGVESDLNGLARAPGGALHVADAGGNALYRVDRRTGAVRLVTVFAGLPSALPNPSRGGAAELDPVPTGVVTGPDGSAYVGLLSGFPFPSGGARVVRVAPDGAVSTVADGLTTVVDLAFGRDGALYVLEFASGFDLGPEAQGWRRGTGRILRLAADGTRRVMADGLDQPFGMAIGRRGDVYVTERTNTTPAEGAQGRVLRFRGLAR
jgi:sugar lactone lactonase YvrE